MEFGRIRKLLLLMKNAGLVTLRFSVCHAEYDSERSLRGSGRSERPDQSPRMTARTSLAVSHK